MTYRELLNRLIDLKALAVPPDPGERAGCMSSYDRSSQYDQATGRYVNWEANDDGSGCVRRLDDGSIVAFCLRNSMEDPVCCEPWGTPVAVRSTDEGRTWEVLGDVPLPEGVGYIKCHEPHVIELANGDLLGAIRVETPFDVYLSRSTDGGKTWSTMEDVGCKGSPPHLLRHSSGAIICVVGYRDYAPKTNHPGYGQRCMISYDEGKTWDTNLIIRDDGPGNDLGYPASVELDDGSILTIYYQYLPGQPVASILWSRWKLPDR